MSMPDLGKYAVYIWSAYGITAAAFGWMILGSLAYARRWKRKAEEARRR